MYIIIIILWVSHFFSTMSHCEQAAFSFIVKTLEKRDCLEVKEVESSCCVGKKRKGGREKRRRNRGGSEFKSRRMMNLVHIFVMDICHHGKLMFLVQLCVLFAAGFCSMGAVAIHRIRTVCYC